MAVPKYVRRIARLPDVFTILAAHPEGLRLSELAEKIGVPEPELRDDLLAFYAADTGPLLLGLARPPYPEFFGPDGEVDPNEAESVRLNDDRLAEEIGVEHVDASELAQIYTAATALLELEPDDSDLAAAIEVLTETIFGEHQPTHRAAAQWQHFVEQMRTAITARRRVRIVYSRSWHQGVIDRVIDPYRLVQTRRGWEVDAGPPDQEGALRTYLIGNLRSLEVLGDDFEAPLGLDAKLAAQRTTTPVRVRIPHAARWAADFHAERVGVVEDDEFSVTVDLDLLPPVQMRLGLLLLAAGIDAQVIDPPRLVTTGPRLAAQLLAHHRG